MISKNFHFRDLIVEVKGMAALLLVCCFGFLSASLPFVDASAAGTETLVGIVGRDFVLLGADSSVSQSIALTASNLDKISHLVDPFPDALTNESNGNGNGDGDGDFQQKEEQTQKGERLWKGRQRQRRQQTILAAAAGDAADSDRLLGYLKAIGSLEEYKNGCLGCDVRCVSLDDERSGSDSASASALFSTANDVLHHNQGLDARSMAHLARRCIWERLRSRTPYKICLLMAGMMLEEHEYEYENKDERPARFQGDSAMEVTNNKNNNQAGRSTAFLSQKVQNQVQQALGHNNDFDDEQETPPANQKIIPYPKNKPNYKPSLFWLDEYGSLQGIEYGAHGHGSNFLLSILDQHYRPDLTKTEALTLMKECFEELRSRYVINSPEAPCIKCVDLDGVTVM